MIELKHDAPLQWPEHLPRTDRLRRGTNPQFNMGMTEQEAIGYLQDEVSRTQEISSAQLSCNAMNIMSPMPTKHLSKDPGAALTVKVNGQAYTIASDKWMLLSHNIYTLHLAVRQFRQLSEWGIAPLNILLTGLSKEGAQTSPQQGNSHEVNWYSILGVSIGCSLEDANNAYRHKAKQVGLDNEDGLQELNLAIAAAREYFKHRRNG